MVRTNTWPAHAYWLMQFSELHRTVKCEVIAGGWPEDDKVLDGADAVVMYADGGGGHPALGHLDVLGKHIARGVGFSCLLTP